MARSNVVRLVVPEVRARKRKGLPGWQGDDDVFFHRRQLSIGTHVVDYGRKRHGERWVIIEFRRYVLTGAGTVRMRRIHEGNAESLRLVDEVVVRRVAGNETRVMTFSRMSYAATWRLG